VNVIRIVIADDHTIMREGLKRILEGAEDIEVCGEATNGFETLALVRKSGFDLRCLSTNLSRDLTQLSLIPRPRGCK